KGYFFFSSRRRHTRLQGDWSSDVCSSDLDFGAAGCDFELQVQVNGNWKAYQRWTACGPGHPLIFSRTSSVWTDPTKNTRFEDPEIGRAACSKDSVVSDAASGVIDIFEGID